MLGQEFCGRGIDGPGLPAFPELVGSRIRAFPTIRLTEVLSQYLFLNKRMLLKRLLKKNNFGCIGLLVVCFKSVSHNESPLQGY